MLATSALVQNNVARIYVQERTTIMAVPPKDDRSCASSNSVSLWNSLGLVRCVRNTIEMDFCDSKFIHF